MNWIKAEVTPGAANTEIKPGTTDEKIGEEFKLEDAPKVPEAGAPEGDQKEPSTGVKEEPEVHKDDKQPTPPGPSGDQKEVKMDTHTEMPLDVKEENSGKITEKAAGLKWLKAESTMGEENKDIKPGTKDESVGYDYKEDEGEKINVQDEPSGDQKEPSEGTDEKIGEEYKEEGNQEVGDVPEGDQKEPKEETNTSIGEEYKEEGPHDLPPANAMLKKASWLKSKKKQSFEERGPISVPEKYASFGKVAEDFAILRNIYNIFADDIEDEHFGKAVAHLSIKEASEMMKNIDSMYKRLRSSIDRTAPMLSWKPAAGGFLKNDDGITIVAKTKEEATKIDRCVEAKLADSSFKPKAGRTKKQSAYAICTASVLGTSASLIEEKVDLDPIKASIDARAETDVKFAELAKTFDLKAYKEKVAKAPETVDLVKLAHYGIECPNCFDAVMKSIERGLVPSDFKKA